MALSDSVKLMADGVFVGRVQCQIVSSAISIYNEVANEIHTLAFTGTVTGGTYTLTYAGQVTAAIPFNASAAAVQVALQALTTIGNNNALVGGGPGPTTLTVTFVGSLAASPHPLIVATSSLTGTTPGMTVTRSTNGVSAANHTTRQQLATNVLRNPSGYAALMVAGVAVDATVLTDYGANGVNGQSAVTDAHIANATAALWNAYAG